MQVVFGGKEKEEGLLRKFTGKEISSHILFELNNKGLHSNKSYLASSMGVPH